MTDPILQMYLPAFMLIATGLIVFWKQFRKFSIVTESLPNIENITEYNRLKRIGGIFWIVFSAFNIMTMYGNFSTRHLRIFILFNNP